MTLAEFDSYIFMLAIATGGLWFLYYLIDKVVNYVADEQEEENKNNTNV